MTYSETIDFLNGIRASGQILGLETMRALLGELGNPQDGWDYIHIAGTNGKGSVAAMCHAVLTEAGYRAGLYTSPHLVSFCERIQVNGQPIAEADVVRLVGQLRPALERVASHADFRAPTFFETVTALALLYFREQHVEIAVWETGLGGRLDATNVVTPLVSAITNIALDHMQYLGDSLAEIAAEKSGIIKPRVPVVTAAIGAEELTVIRETCQAAACPLTVVGEAVQADRLGEDERFQRVRLRGTRQEYGTLAIPLLGQHQAVNCATAVAAIEASGLPIRPEQMRDGLLRTNWPGRFQIIGSAPTIVLDGAHNAAAAEQLAATIRERFGGRPLTLIFGVLRDKNYDLMVPLLSPLARQIFCVPVNNSRTCDAAQLAGLFRAANSNAAVTEPRNVVEALAAAPRGRDDVIVITGSLFLVGEALNRLAVTAVSDRELTLQ